MSLKSSLSKLALPLSGVFAGITGLRNMAYDNKVLKENKLDVPVISVGNITAGGTGKTPMVSLITDYFISKNKKTLVLSRGYGRQSDEQLEVKQNGDAKLFGDEPLLIKNKNPKAMVYVGAGRFELGQSVMQSKEVDVVVADDAFQHRSLARDLNILLIDATEALENYQLLPVGRLRESLSSVSRANCLIYTKVNLAERAQYDKLRVMMTKYLAANTPAFEAHSVLEHSIPEGSKVLLVSGIAKPSSFEGLLKEDLDVCGHLIYADHYNYVASDAQKILDKKNQLKADYVLTTEKDIVKLNEFPDLSGHIKAIKLKIEIHESERFYEVLDSIFI